VIFLSSGLTGEAMTFSATVGSFASPRSSPSAPSVTAFDSLMMARCVLSATPFQKAALPSCSP